MKKLILAVMAVCVVIAVKAVINERTSEPGVEKIPPSYTFRSCERHLGVLLYLFGEDPADWPEHEHAPMPGDERYHPMFKERWAQNERDFIVYSFTPHDEHEWRSCDRIEGVKHVHPTDPELAERQHEPYPLIEEHEAPPGALEKSATLITPEDWDEPFCSSETERLKEELDELEIRLQLMLIIQELVEELERRPAQPAVPDLSGTHEVVA